VLSILSLENKFNNQSEFLLYISQNENSICILTLFKGYNVIKRKTNSFFHRPLTLSPLPLDDFIKKWTHQKPPETHQKDLVKIMSDVEKPMSFLNLSKLLTSDELSYQISHKQTNQLEVRMKIVHCKSWNSFCKIVYSFWCAFHSVIGK
jgi:hypothetical protein